MTAKAQKYTATLIKGKTYSVIIPKDEDDRKPKSVSFEKNVPKTVSAEVKELLEETAFRTVFIDGEEEKRMLFKFEPITDEVGGGTKPTTRKAPTGGATA